MSKFQELINDDKPLLVDFSAEWCGPCKVLAPELKKFANRMGDQLRVIKVDVDRNPQAASHFQVQGVPTLILFRKGKQLWRSSGAMNVGQLVQAIEPVLSSQT